MHVIKTIKQTCFACPSQWEGKTENDDDIYIRFRWGTLRLDINGETIASMTVSDGLDGIIDMGEVMEYLGGHLSWSDTAWHDYYYGE